jgi:hypothetical protein
MTSGDFVLALTNCGRICGRKRSGWRCKSMKGSTWGLTERTGIGDGGTRADKVSIDDWREMTLEGETGATNLGLRQLNGPARLPKARATA